MTCTGCSTTMPVHLSARAAMRPRSAWGFRSLVSRAQPLERKVRLQCTGMAQAGSNGKEGSKWEFRGWTPKGFRLEDQDVAMHIESFDRKLTKSDQFRSKMLPDYNPRHKIVIDSSEQMLKKAANQARKNFIYEETLKELSIELVHLQEYVKDNGLKVAIVFEGRDAAGKGGVISRISAAMSPRVCRICALGVPTERERGQWYFQRYIKHLPSAGEIVLFDRSWYNRAGVERVMGFCTDEEYEEFMRSVPLFEEMLTNSGIILLKYWFSVSSAEQEKRFIMRMSRSWKRWKLSPMDLFSRTKWEEYSKAKDIMMQRTASVHAPWWVIPSTNKKEARLNCISHLLASIDYETQQEYEDITLPPRGPTSGYIRPQESPNVDCVPIVYSAADLFPPRKPEDPCKVNPESKECEASVEAKDTSKYYTRLSAPDDLSVGERYRQQLEEREQKKAAKKAKEEAAAKAEAKAEEAAEAAAEAAKAEVKAKEAAEAAAKAAAEAAELAVIAADDSVIKEKEAAPVVAPVAKAEEVNEDLPVLKPRPIFAGRAPNDA